MPAGTPKREPSAQMRISHALAITMPPPMQKPLIIAMTGTGAAISEAVAAVTAAVKDSIGRRIVPLHVELRDVRARNESLIPGAPHDDRADARVDREAATAAGRASHMSRRTAFSRSGWLKVSQPIGPSCAAIEPSVGKLPADSLP